MRSTLRIGTSRIGAPPLCIGALRRAFGVLFLLAALGTNATASAAPPATATSTPGAADDEILTAEERRAAQDEERCCRQLQQDFKDTVSAVERRSAEAGKRCCELMKSELDEIATEPNQGSSGDQNTRVPKERSFTEAFIQMVLYLGAICLLAYLVLGKLLPRLLRIEPPLAQRRILQVIDRLVIDQRRSIMVLKIGDLYFLVGASEQGIGLISRLEPDEVQTALATAGVSSKPPLGRLAGVFARRSQKEADSP